MKWNRKRKKNTLYRWLKHVALLHFLWHLKDSHSTETQKRLWQIFLKIERDLKNNISISNSNIAFFMLSLVVDAIFLITTISQMPWEHKTSFFCIFKAFKFRSRFVYLPFQMFLDLCWLYHDFYLPFFVCIVWKYTTQNHPGNSHFVNVPFKLHFIAIQCRYIIHF